MDGVKFKSYRLFSAFIILLLSIVLGCGGGSGGDDGSEEPVPDNNDETPADDTAPDDNHQRQALNGPLTGHLFASRWGKYLDLSTGEYTQIADGRGDVAIYPSADGHEYVATIDNHHLVEDEACYGFLIDVDVIEIRDIHSNLVNDRFEVFENLWGLAKLSPDGEAVAVRWENDKGCPQNTYEYLTVFSRTGEILSQSQEEISQFDWLPDNRLIYAKDKTIYVANTPHRVDGEPIRSLAEIDGDPYRITASRDGSRILFEMMTKVPSWLESITYRNATVWSMNVDGSDLKQFATTRRVDDPDSDTDDPRINNPVFSLDDTEVLLTEDYFSGIAFVREWYDDDLYEVIPLENSGLMYSVPADSENLPLPPDGTYPARVMRSVNSEGEVVPVDEMIISTLKLVPKVASPTENPGSLPGQSALNRGINGSLYYIDSESDPEGAIIRHFDIATGVASAVFYLTDEEHDEYDLEIGSSEDGEYWSYAIEDRGETNIYILDSAGNQLVTIPFTDDSLDLRNEGAAQFSPIDNELIAFQYEYDAGDGALNESKRILVANWRQDQVLSVFSEDYIHPRWTPDGNLLFFDLEGGVYRVDLTGETFNEPQLLYRLPGKVDDPALSHDGTRMAFSMARHLWVCNIDGTGLTQLTSPTTDGSEISPVWSPDNRYILFKSADDGDDDGALWVIAADADHVRIDHRSNTAIPVKDAERDQLDHIYGTLTWR
jgi:Tol biopolymer transport system component